MVKEALVERGPLHKRPKGDGRAGEVNIQQKNNPGRGIRNGKAEERLSLELSRKEEKHELERKKS